MARPIWKGLLNFGLVNIPVELHSAARDHTPFVTDILAFVPLDPIDVRYWDTPYLAVAAKGAEHSYAG